MTDAVRPLTLPPEAEAIIAQGIPQPQTVSKPVTIDAISTQPLPAAAPTTLPKPQARAKPDKVSDEAEVVSVSATYRLPKELIAMLLKAASERKLKKLSPYTQQDIVAEALAAWLQKNG